MRFFSRKKLENIDFFSGGGGNLRFFCLVITRINSTFVIGNDLPGKTGFCFQRFGAVSGSETEIPGAKTESHTIRSAANL